MSPTWRRRLPRIGIGVAVAILTTFGLLSDLASGHEGAVGGAVGALTFLILDRSPRA